MILPSLVAILSFGILGDITFEQFFEVSKCGILGTTTSIKEVDPKRIQEEYKMPPGYPLYSLRATIRIEEILVSLQCEPLGNSVDVLFSDEVHSSHPRLHETAALFLRRKGEAWVEVPYGRGYWPLVREHGRWMVPVDSRNDFLLGPLRLRSDEKASVPLNAVIRALKRLQEKNPAVSAEPKEY